MTGKKKTGKIKIRGSKVLVRKNDNETLQTNQIQYNKMEAIKSTNFNFPGLKDIYYGKVRDVYNIERIIKEDIKEFVGGAEHSDDITMLILKYYGNT